MLCGSCSAVVTPTPSPKRRIECYNYINSTVWGGETDISLTKYQITCFDSDVDYTVTVGTVKLVKVKNPITAPVRTFRKFYNHTNTAIWLFSTSAEGNACSARTVCLEMKGRILQSEVVYLHVFPQLAASHLLLHRSDASSRKRKEYLLLVKASKFTTAHLFINVYKITHPWLLWSYIKKATDSHK